MVSSSNPNSGSKSNRFHFCFAYNHTQCHYGINCRFLHGCMICNGGFHTARLCTRHSYSRVELVSWCSRRTNNYRPPHLQRKESLDRICFLVILIKSLHFKLCPELLRGKMLKQILCSVHYTAKFVVTSLFRQSTFI